MDNFEVKGLEQAAKLLLAGLLAGVLFYVVNKYVLTPAETALNISLVA